MIQSLNFDGLIIGTLAFFLIGLFHPIVIKTEYYFGTKAWWLFALLGIAGLVLILLVKNNILSIILGIVSCCMFWSIKELFDQKERVRKGWFPKNPKRKH